MVQHIEISCLDLLLMENANWLVNNNMRDTAGRSRDRNQRGIDNMSDREPSIWSRMDSQDGVFKRD